MITPLAFADSLRIGSVDYVSPNEIKVLLDIEAPNDVALNTGVPRPFPRINNYLLLPSDSGFLVAQIEWITIEHSQYPKRKGMQDFGVVDLPFPLRKMSLIPLGMLREEISDKEKESKYVFSRGVEVFPTVGDPVLLPSQKQLKSIVESGENRRVKIGTSPLASNADVSVDPDRLFGRHLAILGNTGSGKSCSVAGVIRWSIEAAKATIGKTDPINSRFIILDPNGEYSHVFKDMKNVSLFAVEADEKENVRQLQVPLWFWNSAEWCAFTQASSKMQRPTLIQALRCVRDGSLDVALTPSTEMRRYLRTLVTLMSIENMNGSPWAGGGKTKGFKDCIDTWENGLVENDSYSMSEKNTITTLKQAFSTFRNSNQSTSNRREEWPIYPKPEVERLLVAIKEAYISFGGSDQDILPIDADVPRQFIGNALLRSIQANAELMKATEYIEPMLMRVRTLLSDSRMKAITSCSEHPTLKEWLDEYICPNDSVMGAITIIDLSLIPAEVIHIITAVIARMILEALQRYRRMNNGETLPTALIMEEAHTFIRRYTSDSDETPAYSMCTQVFEKIAREGRKFGLGLVLSSQRPSELSQTVLSQCNTFLLHRISNDRDQELVNKLVPDNLRGLLRELPSLPSQRAILLGWASELPIMVQMKHLDKEYRPQSNDPDYWNIWTGGKERKVNWEDIAHDWQGAGQTKENSTEQVEEEPEMIVQNDGDDDLPF